MDFARKPAEREALAICIRVARELKTHNLRLFLARAEKEMHRQQSRVFSLELTSDGLFNSIALCINCKISAPQYVLLQLDPISRRSRQFGLEQIFVEAFQRPSLHYNVLPLRRGMWSTPQWPDEYIWTTHFFSSWRGKRTYSSSSSESIVHMYGIAPPSWLVEISSYPLISRPSVFFL
jgi:hypothetical protein